MEAVERIKLVTGYVLAFLIGVGCHWLAIPLPAPTAMLGAFIVLALTSGYLVTDHWLVRQDGEAEESGESENDA